MKNEELSAKTFEHALNRIEAMCVLGIIKGHPEIAEYFLATGRPAPWLDVEL
jgi:hypothetical protein